MKRRDYLTAVGATLIATAGCLGSGHTQAGADAWDMTEVPTERAYQAYGSVELAAGEFAAWRATPPQQARLTEEITVHQGDAIDVYWLPKGEMGRYRNAEQNINGYTAISDWNVRTLQTRGTLPAEECYLVIDNSGEYGATPEGDVLVHVDIELAW